MNNYSWINQPKIFKESSNKLMIQTQKGTDMWQRTHYGFQRINAPMYLRDVNKKRFVYKIKTKFNSNSLYDQCGVIVYLDQNNWAKFSSEFENDQFQRLGGVVTKSGYSDWSTQNISATINTIYYQITREQNDFIVAYSFDNIDYYQMRIFNLAYGNFLDTIGIGLYACSPQGNGFKANFEVLSMQPKS
ncbi:DUF1349 domain-containing protein [Lacticaseibacillus paracasei]|uniref:DUF1349 domain-containing protein n=1 Tax=Lacticaseibacillus paracasei TaxID=1597 RepID=UPI0005B47A3F|nr:DUF1349 domain-containing protein [Lacticaseibacillus paracasei]WBS98891.1 DUF1349 domain-containing protein [Lacticaseibacillus paracasei]